MTMASLHQIPAAGKHRQLPVSLLNQPHRRPRTTPLGVSRRPPHQGNARPRHYEIPEGRVKKSMLSKPPRQLAGAAGKCRWGCAEASFKPSSRLIAASQRPHRGLRKVF